MKEQTTGAKDQDSLHVRCAEKVLVAGVVTIIVASIDVSSTKTGGGNPRLLTYKSILLLRNKTVSQDKIHARAVHMFMALDQQ